MCERRNGIQGGKMDLPNHSFSFTDIPDWVKVGKYTSIASGCTFHRLDQEHLCSVNHDCVFTYNWDQPTGSGEIKIGSDVWIGMGVRILPNVTISDGAMIGAGSVIAEDVLPYSVVVGNPQQLVRFRFSKVQIQKLLELKWWDWPYPHQYKDDMKDITNFLKIYG